MKTLLAFLIITSTALAQYPEPEPAGLTDEQHKAWADARNVQLRIEWESKKAKSLAEQPQQLQGAVVDDGIGWSISGDCGSYGGSYGGCGYNHYGDDFGNRFQYGEVQSHRQVRQVQYDNPKYVNPGPLTTINRYAPPRPTTEAEAAAIKKSYDEADGEEHTVKSKDGKGVLHFKVL